MLDHIVHTTLYIDNEMTLTDARFYSIRIPFERGLVQQVRNLINDTYYITASEVYVL